MLVYDSIIRDRLHACLLGYFGGEFHGWSLGVIIQTEDLIDHFIPMKIRSSAGFTLAYNAGSEAEVDEIINDLRSKGVKIVKEPQKVFWGGYSSYFTGPDDNRWEVAHNPFFPFNENGNLKLE